MQQNEHITCQPRPNPQPTITVLSWTTLKIFEKVISFGEYLEKGELQRKLFETKQIAHVTAKGRATLLEANKKREDGKTGYVDHRYTQYWSMPGLVPTMPGTSTDPCQYWYQQSSVHSVLVHVSTGTNNDRYQYYNLRHIRIFFSSCIIFSETFLNSRQACGRLKFILW